MSAATRGLWNPSAGQAAFTRMAEASVTVPGLSPDALAGIARTAEASWWPGSSSGSRRVRAAAPVQQSPDLRSDGGLLNHHRKLVPTYTSGWSGPGRCGAFAAVDTPRAGGRLVCWEHWMPWRARDARVGRGGACGPLPPCTRCTRCQPPLRLRSRCFVLAAGSVRRAAALPAGLEPHPDGSRVRPAGAPGAAPSSHPTALPGRAGVRPAEVLVAELDLAERRAESMTLDVTGPMPPSDCSTSRAPGAPAALSPFNDLIGTR